MNWPFCGGARKGEYVYSTHGAFLTAGRGFPGPVPLLAGRKRGAIPRCREHLLCEAVGLGLPGLRKARCRPPFPQTVHRSDFFA